MKLKYIFGLFLSALLMVACSEDTYVGNHEVITLDKTLAIVPAAGGDVVVKVNAKKPWEMKKTFYGDKKDTKDEHKDLLVELPTWVTASALKGDAGETAITFHADACEYGRACEIEILCDGKSQFVTVRQGEMKVEDATCADVIAGADGKTYRVRGVCTAILNTTYGNWDLDDGTGVIRIYGTLNKDGETKKYTEWGMEVGDIVTVEGPKTTYGTTIELVDVTVIKIEKAMLKICTEEPTIAKEGGKFVAKVAYKGSGVFTNIDDEAKSWISVDDMSYAKGVPTKLERNPADTAMITFSVAPNTASARQGVINFTSSSDKGSTSTNFTVTQLGGITECSVAEFLAAEVGETQYKITGRVTNRTDISGHKFDLDTYGNFDLVDATGNVYVYGVLTGEGGASKQFGTLGVKEGDIITVIGKRAEYKGAPQMGSAYFVANTPVTKISAADFNALADDAETWYELTGVVTDGTAQSGHKFDLVTYGNFDLVDETGDVYVYGVSTGWNGVSKQFGTLGVKEGDKLTITCHKSSYKNAPQAGSAWYVKHESQEE